MRLALLTQAGEGGENGSLSEILSKPKEKATMTISNWSFTANYIETCNCDYGCPCNFNGLPNYGSCQAMTRVRGWGSSTGGTLWNGSNGLASW